MELEKLQKVLASAGVGSRRKVEELIAEGVVQVNGKTANIGQRVDKTKDKIEVNGEQIHTNENVVTIALNKPEKVVSTMSDDKGRVTLTDLVGDKFPGLFHIGRLDYDSSGLLLMTNDGGLAQRVAHPTNEMLKIYSVIINGVIKPYEIKKLLKGVNLKDGPSKFDKVKILDANRQVTLLQVFIHSGKNRIIRRTFKEIGYQVLELCRTQIGPIKLGELKPGRSRVLSQIEIQSLLNGKSY
jgi:23S rRNA pseudouridine2605 synthase